MRNICVSVIFCLFIMIMVQGTAQEASDCALPTDIQVSFVAGKSALVSWSWSPGALPSSTVVRHRVDGHSLWTESFVSDTCLMLTDLNQHTHYEVTVLTLCGSDTVVSPSVFFTTQHYLECLETDPNPTVISGSPQVETGSYPISGALHSYREEIVRAHELSPDGSPVLLTGISYQYASPYPLDTKNHVEIYLTHREDSVYRNSIDFTPLTEASLVYVGDFYCQLGWNYFEFSTPFYFDGIHNLVVFVLDKSVDTANSDKAYHTFRCHHIPNNNVSLGWVTTSPLDLNAPFLPTAGFVRNNMRFSVCSHSESVPCTAPYQD